MSREIRRGVLGTNQVGHHDERYGGLINNEAGGIIKDAITGVKAAKGRHEVAPETIEEATALIADVESLVIAASAVSANSNELLTVWEAADLILRKQSLKQLSKEG